MKYNDTWDLDALFQGGVTGQAFKEELVKLTDQRDAVIAEMNAFDQDAADAATTFADLQAKRDDFANAFMTAITYANMVADADMRNEAATAAVNKLQTLFQPYEIASKSINKKLATLSDEAFQQFLTEPRLAEIAFPLTEERRDAKRLLDDQAEALLSELQVDGLSGWANTYATISSVMTISVDLADGHHDYSVGQAMNKMYADPNPENRAKIFEAWEAAFTQYGPVFADVLNHLAGYRLTTQKAHGYKDFLEEPLEYNRIKRETVEAMWQAIADNKDTFVQFLDRKKALLGLSELNWQDVEAPLNFDDAQPTTYTYDDAAEFVVENFRTFGDKLADFAEYALENRWIEAEDRPGKRPGGYSTEPINNGESRIFMTFTGSRNDTQTLAHELGHSFHTDVLKDEPASNQAYAMNVAETASTFAEQIVSAATLATAQSKSERLQLLNAKLENATAMFMNIRSRFLFETAFYTERQKGFISESRLNALMSEAQKEAFGDALSETHPHFWASKLHFFFDDVPFYNFPYTFGYLFSLGIYAEYLKQPEGFEERYIALLKDTGKMTTEDLAKKHLNVDLTQADFWQAAIDIPAADVKAFLDESADLI
ncbi:M3 family oligoendopeptidase [Aerococcus sp. 1KP-2016]|uniref:M3 family oligoendopeptidase n=1 Tax=Aerococcus sp. 1KP-2016 TaxID=1981982 RepID=UPI000B9916CB|nr:M3 family oligoendopeptidase [Aerococcus sp. 1KP-2016]OYQ67480.1 oligoendopeptidase [Aerococcus sp. 1KP-2016]